MNKDTKDIKISKRKYNTYMVITIFFCIFLLLPTYLLMLAFMIEPISRDTSEIYSVSSSSFLYYYKHEHIYIFESNKCEIDSFEYVGLYRFDSANNFYETVNNDSEVFYDRFDGYKFKIYNSQKKYYGYFSLPGSFLSRFWETYVTKKYRVSFGIYENNIYSNVLKSLDILKSDSHDFKLMDFEMNGNVYNDCIIGENDVSSDQNLAEKYVISKKLGLLYYKLRTGEEFFRIRPLPGKIYLTIDGKPVDFPYRESLDRFLSYQYLDENRIEVSLNGRVINKDNWHSTLLSDGDSISIECHYKRGKSRSWE